MSATKIQAKDRFSLEVHGYDGTPSAARPPWAHAAVIVKDETKHPDDHDARGLICAGFIRSDPFRTPYWFGTGEEAEAAARHAATLDFLPAVQWLEAARARAARRNR